MSIIGAGDGPSGVAMESGDAGDVIEVKLGAAPSEYMVAMKAMFDDAMLAGFTETQAANIVGAFMAMSFEAEYHD